MNYVFQVFTYDEIAEHLVLNRVVEPQDGWMLSNP